MLLGYDWRLALLCLVFAPISYYIAEQMKPWCSAPALPTRRAQAA